MAGKVKSMLEDETKALEQMNVLQCVVVAAPLSLCQDYLSKMDLTKSDPTTPLVSTFSTGALLRNEAGPKSSTELQFKFRDKLSELRAYMAEHRHLPYLVIFSSLDEKYFFFHQKK